MQFTLLSILNEELWDMFAFRRMDNEKVSKKNNNTTPAAQRPVVGERTNTDYRAAVD